MQTWLELEDRFRALSSITQHLRADFQWGAAGEHLYTTGATSGASQFAALCQIAGNLITQALPKDKHTEGILNEASPDKRWLKALKEWSGTFQLFQVVHQTGDEDGNHAGPIFLGSINRVVEVSADFCLLLHAQHPLMKSSTSNSGTTVNNYVVNSQVGIINSGEIHHVKNIAVNVGRLQEKGEKDIAEAISRLLESVAASDSLSAQDKSATLEQLEELSKQAILQPSERRVGIIKAVVAGLGATLGAAGSLADIWSTWGPAIQAFFQV